MNFANALDRIQQGKKVTRVVWNRKEDQDKDDFNQPYLALSGDYVTLFGFGIQVANWSPTKDQLEAKDWYILKDK